MIVKKNLLDVDSDDLEGCLDKVANAVGFSTRKNIIASDWLLQHQIHALHIIFCMAPISNRVQIP